MLPHLGERIKSFRLPEFTSASPSMCVAVQGAAMFEYTYSCRRPRDTKHRGYSSVGDLPDLDPSPPPAMSPKLFRSAEAAAASAAAATAPYTVDGGSEGGSLQNFPLPAEAVPLKLRLLRRRDSVLHFLASARGDVEELSAWLSAGGDPNARDEDGWGLLEHASSNGRVECVELLIRSGARLDAASPHSGHTVLHMASAKNHCDVVKCLVEAGASTDTQNAHGSTPLHSAAATGTVHVLAYLLSKSANPDVVNSLGETPDAVEGAGSQAAELIEEARRRKQDRIAQRLSLLHLHKLWSSGRAQPRTALGSDSALEAAVGVEASAASAPTEAPRFDRRDGDETPPDVLEPAVAGVTTLPEEVFRRFVAFCSL